MSILPTDLKIGSDFGNTTQRAQNESGDNVQPVGLTKDVVFQLPSKASTIVLVGSLFAAVAGLIINYQQLRVSTDQFVTEMNENRKTRSAQLLTDFYQSLDRFQELKLEIGKTQAGAMRVDEVVVARTGLLLRSLATQESKSQILNYLYNNGYESIFSSALYEAEEARAQFTEIQASYMPKEKVVSRQVNMMSAGAPQKPELALSSVDLSSTVMSGIRFRGTSFKCVDGNRIRFDGGQLDQSNIIDTDMSYAKFNGVSLDNSRIQRSSLSGVMFEGQLPSFVSAEIHNSDLTNIRVNRRLLTNPTEKYDYTDSPGASTSEHKVVAEALSKAKSLYGTQLDSDVVIELQAILGKEGYAELMSVDSVPPGQIKHAGKPFSQLFQENCTVSSAIDFEEQTGGLS